MNKRWAMTGVALAAGVLSLAGTASASYWTPWVSEANGGPETYCNSWSEGAVGFGCSGSWCGSVRLLCQAFNGGMSLDSSSYYYTPWFSEEGALGPGVGSTSPAGNEGSCRMGIPGTIDSWAPGVVSGVACSGAHCDKMQLECERPVKYNGGVAIPATAYSCHSAGTFSEEQGSRDFGTNQYIYNVACSGGYCDNLTFTVCHWDPPF
jgi:hypothetical protein